MPTDQKYSFQQTNVQAFVLFILAVLLYSNTLTFKYALDDTMMITGNSFTLKGIDGTKDIFTSDSFHGLFGKSKKLVAGGRYRPLSHFMFAVEYEFFGKNPMIGHLINILLYGFLAVVIFLCLDKMFKKHKSKKLQWYLSIPFLATLFYIFHPLHSEAVANIKGRDEIMTFLGAMLSLLITLKYLESRKLYLLALNFVVFFLALISKENAITFLAIIPLTIIVFDNKTIKDHIICLSPLVLASILMLFIRYQVLGYLFSSGSVSNELLNNPFLYASASEESATVLFTWWKYFQLLFIPHPLTHDYYPKQIAIIDWSSMKAILPTVLYAALFTFAIIKVWKKNIFAYIILFFLATFSIASNLLFNIGTFMNERFLFIPSLAFSILTAYLIYLLINSEKKSGRSKQKLAIAIVLIITTAYGVKTFSRSFAWKDDFTLFTTDVANSSNSIKCNVSAGGMYVEKAKKEKNELKKKVLISKAVTHLTKGVKLHSRNIVGWLLLGNAYLQIEDYGQSINYYENCLKLNKNYKDALNNLLYSAQKCGVDKNYSESRNAYKTLLKYHPDDVSYKFELAKQYKSLNQLDSSLFLLKSIINTDPDNHPSFNQIGEIFGKHLNRMDSAIVYLEKGYAIDSTNSSILENLGIAHGIKGNFSKSVFFFEEALKQTPNNINTYINFGKTYMRMGQKKKAEALFAKASAIKKSEEKQ